MNLNKDAESWARVDPKAVLDGSRAQAVLNERWDDLGYAGRFAVIATEENVVWLIGQGG